MITSHPIFPALFSTAKFSALGTLPGFTESPTYEVEINGTKVPVFTTEGADFVQVWFDRPLEVVVTAKGEFGARALRPASAGIRWSAAGNQIDFTWDRPVCLMLEGPGNRELYLYGHQPLTKSDLPDRSTKGLHYVRSGERLNEGIKILKTGERLYLEPGGVLRGAVQAHNAEDITIDGAGVLDGSAYSAGLGGIRSIFLDTCTNSRVEGITMLNPSTWMLVIGGSRDVVVRNIRQIGACVSSDGVDIVGSSNILVEDCCLRNNDDCIAIKAMDRGYFVRQLPEDHPGFHANVENVLVQNCTMYNDKAGNALEIGFETRCTRMSGIVFRNIDVVAAHGEGGVFTVHNGDRTLVEDVLYEDIRVEHYYDRLIDLRVMFSRYSLDKERGQIRNIRFKKIRAVENYYNAVSLIGGFVAERPVENVHLEDFQIDGERVLDPDALQLYSRHVKGLSFS